MCHIVYIPCKSYKVTTQLSAHCDMIFTSEVNQCRPSSLLTVAVSRTRKYFKRHLKNILLSSEPEWRGPPPDDQVQLVVQQPDAARQQTLLSVLAANPRTEAEPRHAQPGRQAAPAKQQQAQAQQVSSKHTISLQ